jgi:hypothetical protein
MLIFSRFVAYSIRKSLITNYRHDPWMPAKLKPGKRGFRKQHIHGAQIVDKFLSINIMSNPPALPGGPK